VKSLASIRSKVFVLGVGVLVGASAFQAAPPPDGTAIYKQHCAMCHGADGKGFAAIKTPDFTDPKWQASTKDKEIVEVIKNGKKGTPMPAFSKKLKDDEMRAVVAYIRSLDSKKK
jgi:cbb3-type cytochrome c oxidase subunit III